MQYSAKKRLISYAGGYSKVFPIKIKNNKIALRFWTANIDKAQEKYKEIDEYLKTKKLSYFVNFNYHNNLLNWKNKKFSFISMDWVDGLTLNKYIDKNIKNSKKIKDLADSFLEMVKVLHINNIAHGDLQDGNILVIENGNSIELKLIDYDSIYVPKLKDFSINVLGVEAYQHPKKNDLKKLNEKLDYFSELVIYISLLVYSENSNLWEDGQEQKLLFDAKDFKNSSKSKIFNKLKNDNYSSEVFELVIKLEEYCQEKSINNLLPLEESIVDKFKEIQDKFKKINSISNKQIIDNSKINKDMDSIKNKFKQVNSISNKQIINNIDKEIDSIKDKFIKIKNRKSKI